MSAPTAPLDRRHRRRLETMAEVLDHALAIMAEEGVAGLSLGEIARRMGIRPPSLYVYFPSKHALYDALFQRGWEQLLADMATHEAEQPMADSLGEFLTDVGAWLVRWSLTNRAYAQLLFWRPVPGFEPSPAAYEPATRFYEVSLDRFRGLQEHGAIRPDADVDVVLQQWTVIVSGVVSQQLANEPDQPFEGGRFVGQLPELTAMFVAHYAAPSSSPAAPRRPRGTPVTSTTRRGHARQR